MRVNELQVGSDEYGHLKVHPSHTSRSHPLHLSSLLPTASDFCLPYLLFTLCPPLMDSGRMNHTVNQTSLPLRGGAHFPATGENQLSFQSRSVFLTNLPWDSNRYGLQFWLLTNLGAIPGCLFHKLHSSDGMTHHTRMPDTHQFSSKGTNVWIPPLLTPYSTAEGAREKVFLTGSCFDKILGVTFKINT